MPPIKSKKSKKVQQDRPVRYPEVAATVASGENALSQEKLKDLLGWQKETEEVKFGPDYHLTDRNGAKVRLANSTHNRGFDQRLGEKYMYEHLNKRWMVNGEPRILGKYGEVISGQHSMSGAVLAEQERLKDPRWQENWPEPVTMSTIVVVGIEETDDVVNTVDTGKPRSLADTIYRSAYFSDLAPADRKKASSLCQWGIRLVESRTGVEDAFNPRKSHGASLAFLDNHLTLVKIARHVAQEDKGGNVSSVITPGYASALCYLMAASKTDPDQYVNKTREGDRREKYLDLSLLGKAMEFWALVGKPETPELRAVRDRLKSYAKRDKDSLGNYIEVSLEEKIAILTLAWHAFAEGKVPTLKDVTPRYESGEEGAPPMLKDPPRIGGIDMFGDHEEPDVTEQDDDGEGEQEATEESTEDGNEEPPHEKLRKDLEATRPDRVKALLAKRAAEKKAKRAEMAEAVPPTNGKAQSVADEIRADFAKLKAGHEDKVIFAKSKTSGNLTCIDEDADKVAKALGQKVTEESGYKSYVVKNGEVKTTLAKLIKKGLKVAVAEKVTSGFKNESVRVDDFTAE